MQSMQLVARGGKSDQIVGTVVSALLAPRPHSSWLCLHFRLFASAKLSDWKKLWNRDRGWNVSLCFVRLLSVPSG